MVNGKLTDKDLENVAGGDGNWKNYYCSQVSDDDTFKGYVTNAKDDCPYFNPKPGVPVCGSSNCFCCTNLVG